MAKNTVTIVIEVDDEDADPADATGVTEEAYNRITEALMSEVAGIVDVRAGGR